MNQLQVFIGFSPPSIAAAQSFAAQLGALFVTQYWHQKWIILPRQARGDQTQQQVFEQQARLIIFSADRLESHAVGGGLQFHIGHQVRKPRRRLPLFTHAKQGTTTFSKTGSGQTHRESAQNEAMMRLRFSGHQFFESRALITKFFETAQEGGALYSLMH